MLLPVATKAPIFAVEFRYDTQIERYVLGTQQSVTIEANLYSPLPGMDIEFGNYSVTMRETPFTIVLPLVVNEFSDLVSSGFPFAKVEVTVWEVLQSLISPQQEINKLFVGEVVEAYRNYRGRQGLVGLRCLNCKGQLGTPLGIPVNAQCPWVFTSEACGVVAVADTAQVTSLLGKNLTVSWLSGPSPDAEYYFRGYVEFESLRIAIRAWDVADDTEIGLTKEPPPSWLGQVVTVFPGCDKTIEVCRDRWNNEARFGGSGFKMPAYKPIFETPA